MKYITYTDTHSDNWLYKKYATIPSGGMNHRYYTFQLALNLLFQRHRQTPIIIETGCQRQADDFGAGMSTSILAEYVAKHTTDGQLIVVDNDATHLSTARELVNNLFVSLSLIPARHIIHYNCSDSVAFLTDYTGTPPSLLYLDSYDYPYVEMMWDWQKKQNLATTEIAHEQISKMSRSAILDIWGDWIRPCQEHCLREFQVIESRLDPTTILLVDDNALPGGGKPGTLKPYLLKQGWICLLDSQQTLWVRSI